METEARKQLVKIAIYYYYENMNQAQIAKKMGISRTVISRQLQKAKDLGIVNIYIHDKNYHISNMELQLEEKFNLRKVNITPSFQLSEDEILLSVVHSAIPIIRDYLHQAENVGISWGNTLRILAREFPYEPHESINLFPLIGGMGNEFIYYHSNQICYDLMKKFHCKSNFVYAPAVVEDKQLYATLSTNANINSVLERGKQVDMAVMGISAPHRNGIMKKINYMTKTNMAELLEKGSVGDMNSRFFDRHGKEVNCEMNNSVIGVGIEDIKAIPLVICIASGLDKKDAILTAAQNNLMDILVTDDQVADYLLKN